MIPFFSRMFPGTNLQDLNLDWICRRIMELSKGIIAPWINSANLHWMVYDTTAETFVDSGVSAAGEGTGPQGEPGKSPVIGSNGNWYIWDTTTEAYTDTGTQAEGPTGPEGPEGPEGPRGAGINRNLIVNGYFVGGGSQQAGDRIFPINQHGQGQYSSGKVIDMWSLTGSILNLELQNGFIRIKKTSSSGNPGFLQILPDNLDGCDVTISILYKTNAPTGTIRLIGTDTTIELPASSDFNIFSTTAKLLKTSFGGYNDKVMFGLQFRADLAVDVPTDIKAIKVELGTEQTLAHNDGTAQNPNWVLNEIPDYGVELLKCQRYFQTFRTEALRPTYGADCRPVMATDEPTKSTLTIGTTTLYTLES